MVDFHLDKSGNMWVATYGGGLNKFNEETKSFTRYSHDPENPGSISSDQIYSLGDARPVAGFMLGLSGIGYFYLRLAEPNYFPSYLMLNPSEQL